MESSTDNRTGWRRLAGWVAGLSWLIVPAVAVAQEDVAKAAQETSIPGGQLAVISYIVLWVLLMGYVLKLALQQKSLEGEIEELEQRIEDSLD
jgi:CcmD family protein